MNRIVVAAHDVGILDRGHVNLDQQALQFRPTIRSSLLASLDGDGFRKPRIEYITNG